MQEEKQRYFFCPTRPSIPTKDLKNTLTAPSSNVNVSTIHTLPSSVYYCNTNDKNQPNFLGVTPLWLYPLYLVCLWPLFCDLYLSSIFFSSPFFPLIQILTKDAVTVSVEAVIYYRISDASAVVNQLENHRSSFISSIQGGLISLLHQAVFLLVFVSFFCFFWLQTSGQHFFRSEFGGSCRLPLYSAFSTIPCSLRRSRSSSIFFVNNLFISSSRYQTEIIYI